MKKNCPDCDTDVECVEEADFENHQRWCNRQ